jgi:probable rRNA maturation factor
MELSIHVDTAADKWLKAFPRMNTKIKAACLAAALAAKTPAAFKNRAFDVNIILSDNATVKKLNREYRGKDMPTNVLSFPQLNFDGFTAAALKHFPLDSTIPLGDIILAYQTVNRESREQSKSMENHVIHLIVHGTLHLLGYDHMVSKEAKAMEKKECDILAKLGYDDPYETCPAQKSNH